MDNALISFFLLLQIYPYRVLKVLVVIKGNLVNEAAMA